MFPSNRIQAVANMVGQYRKVADIGSDHAQLPVWLVQNDIIDFAVAGEVQTGPLTATCRTIHEFGLEKQIDVRLGNGLEVIAPGEVDVVVLAGMGGSAIRNILSRSPEVVCLLNKIICQPMTGAYGLRKWLLEQGWRLELEDLVLEDKRLYEIISVVPADLNFSADLDQTDELLMEIGPLLWLNKHPLIVHQITRLIGQYQKRVRLMVNSGSITVNQQRVRWLDKIVELEAMKKCL